MENINNENVEVELDGQRSPEAQAIIDAELGIEPEVDNEDEGDVELPSDDDNGEPELFAGKYTSEQELVKGIKNIGSTLPEYVIDGMSTEALEKHYLELSKTTKTEDRKPNNGRKFADEEKEVVADKKGESEQPADVSDELWAELEDKFNADGRITSEQYDKLNKAGYSDKMIDRYMDSLAIEKQEQARQIEAFTTKTYELAGGKEAFEDMKVWAEENDPDTVKLLNGMTDLNAIYAVMKGVKASYDAENGSTSNTIRGNRNTVKSNGYKTIQDYNADVNDPRYRTDARYRDKVKAKLAKSNLT